MQRPVLVTPPASLPVSLAEVKRHLYEDSTDNDIRIEDLIRGATEHLDGWGGIIGRCLVEQEWRQDFDRFSRCLPLALGPVIKIVSVTGASGVLDPTSYALKTDAGGRSRVGFSGASLSGAVSIVYKAGYLTIPQDIKTAIIIYVKAHYDENKPDAVASAMRSFDSLVSKHRRVGV